MSTWVLILVLTSGGMTTIDGFNSLQDCKKAGQQITREYGGVFYTCVEKPGIKQKA